MEWTRTFACRRAYSCIQWRLKKDGSRRVAIVLDKKHAEALKSYNPINDKSLTVKINTKYAVSNIIRAIAPTSTSSEEEIENLFNDLQTIRDKIPIKEFIVMGGYVFTKDY